MSTRVDPDALKLTGTDEADSLREEGLFFNPVPSILIGLDSQGRIKCWNDAAVRTFGLEKKDVLGKTLSTCGIHWLTQDIESTIIAAADAGGATTSLVLGQRFKSVVDVHADLPFPLPGPPPNLRKLEDMIDKVAGSSRWVNIDAAGVHEKVRQGWNIRSPEASLLLLKAAELGDAETVRAFIEEGADVNARVDYDARLWCRKPVTDPFRSVTVLQHATGVEVVKLLIAAGANVNPTAIGRSPLQQQTDLGDSESVEALLDAGAKLHSNP